MKTTLNSIATGIAIDYNIKNNIFSSAYKKDNFLRNSRVTTLGLENDFQVDKKYHGGEDKALHIGSIKHFELFKKIHNYNLNQCAIGCNILINDFDESDIYVGDIYSLGEIIIEVSEPRQPCWKIGALFGKEVSRFIIKNRATGWYARVLKEGTINDADTLVLEKRVSEFSIKTLSIYLDTPPEKDTLIQKVLTTKSLSASYKKDFMQTLENNNS